MHIGSRWLILALNEMNTICPKHDTTAIYFGFQFSKLVFLKLWYSSSSFEIDGNAVTVGDSSQLKGESIQK